MIGGYVTDLTPIGVAVIAMVSSITAAFITSRSSRTQAREVTKNVAEASEEALRGHEVTQEEVRLLTSVVLDLKAEVEESRQRPT